MTIYEQLERAENGYKYCNEVLSSGELEVWEEKEYDNLASEYAKKIIQLKEQIKNYEEIYSN